MPISSLTNKTVFLAATDEFYDLGIHLSEKLRHDGAKVLWFHEDFDTNAAGDAMESCIKNATSADYLVWLIGTRFGLTYKAGISISEEEFLAARNSSKPTLVLVRDYVKEEAKRYHDNWKGYEPKERMERAAKYKPEFRTDVRQLETIERLMHMREGDKSAVPWIEQFNSIRNVHEQIHHKWNSWQVQEVNARKNRVAETARWLFPVDNISPPVGKPLEDSSTIKELQSWLEYVCCDRETNRSGMFSGIGAALAAAGGQFMSRKRRTIHAFPKVCAHYIEVFLRACNIAGLIAEEEAFRKFPHCCAYCQLFPCKMSHSRPGTPHGSFDQIGVIQIAEEKVGQHGPFTLDEWALEICDIYPMNWSLSIPQAIERLNEEQGELVQALQKLERSQKSSQAILDLSEEAADVLSWTVVVAQSVRRALTEAAGNDELLSSVNRMVVEQYKAGCPRCKKFQCTRKGICAI